MKIDREILGRHMHQIAAEQMLLELQRKGYRVERDTKIGDFTADLVAEKKGEDTLVIAIKSPDDNPEKREQIKGLAREVRKNKGYRFLITFASLPERDIVDEDTIQNLLHHEMIEKPPNSLIDLSRQTIVEDIHSVVIQNLNIKENGVHVKGDAVVEAELNFDKESDFQISMSFPFTFDMRIYVDEDKGIVPKELNIEVDTSDFYE